MSDLPLLWLKCLFGWQPATVEMLAKSVEKVWDEAQKGEDTSRRREFAFAHVHGGSRLQGWGENIQDHTTVVYIRKQRGKKMWPQRLRNISSVGGQSHVTSLSHEFPILLSHKNIFIVYVFFFYFPFSFSSFFDAELNVSMTQWKLTEVF